MKWLAATLVICTLIFAGTALAIASQHNGSKAHQPQPTVVTDYPSLDSQP